MIVVILHCHYERGGVTQVVENHVRALLQTQQFERIVLASGQRISGLSEEILKNIEWVGLEGFDYDDDDSTVIDLATRQQRMMHELEVRFNESGLHAENVLLHCHNHSLGKNTALPGVLHSLAVHGWRILLQVHDFAEDNRPENYQRLISATNATDRKEIDRYLYPIHNNIQYATLTTADAGVLEKLGVHREQLHCIPNSVAVPQGDLLSSEDARAAVIDVMKLPQDARWGLYPVRGIRRKNVGELLLLGRWAGENRYLGLTLKPATAVELRSYERWRRVAVEVSPRTVFDAGEKPGLSFLQNVLAADYVVSTSVAEGFGMAFLEPWLLNRGVIARRLPTVTDDFERGGLDLESFYDSIPIPGNQAWITECKQETLAAQKRAWKALPKDFQPGIPESLDERDGTIDFARLTPARQVEVLKRMAADNGFERAAMELSKPLISRLDRGFSESVLVSNARKVREVYGASRIGESLLHAYQKLIRLENITCENESVLDDPAAGDSNTTMPSGIDLISAFRTFFPCRTELL